MNEKEFEKLYRKALDEIELINKRLDGIEQHLIPMTEGAHKDPYVHRHFKEPLPYWLQPGFKLPPGCTLCEAPGYASGSICSSQDKKDGK